MSDRLRALAGVGPTPDPASEVPPDFESGTSERLPEEPQSPVHPRSEATGTAPDDVREERGAGEGSPPGEEQRAREERGAGEGSPPGEEQRAREERSDL
jgi:hypothetical protein